MSGGNINPVVRVTVGDQVKQTRVKKSTNRPYYNQVWKFKLSLGYSTFLIVPLRTFIFDRCMGFYKITYFLLML